MSDYADKKWAKAVLKNAGTTRPGKTKIASVDDKKGQPYASVPKNPTDADVAEAKGILGKKSIKENIEEIGHEIDRKMTRKQRAMQKWARGKEGFDAKGLWDAITKNKGGSVKKGDSNYYAHGGSVRKTKLSDY